MQLTTDLDDSLPKKLKYRFSTINDPILNFKHEAFIHGDIFYNQHVSVNTIDIIHTDASFCSIVSYYDTSETNKEICMPSSQCGKTWWMAML